MEIKQAKFITSAASKGNFLEDGTPEIAFELILPRRVQTKRWIYWRESGNCF